MSAMVHRIYISIFIRVDATRNQAVGIDRAYGNKRYFHPNSAYLLIAMRPCNDATLQ
jgi:hypothetical protein